MVVNATDATFKTEFLDSDVHVLVDFWAPWCGPCKMMGPILDSLNEKANNRVKIMKLNIDENPLTASRYEINSIPTVLIFKNGKKIGHLVGVQPLTAYKQALGL